MATITIKSSKPFIEKLVQAKGIKENFKVGVRVYSDTELEPIRKKYLNGLNTKNIKRRQAQLDAITEDLSLTDDEFMEKSSELEAAIEEGTANLLACQKQFLHENVMYIKNASIVIDGKDTLIADTRDAKPIEGLWDSADKCLAVLLDTYLSSFYFRDSLPTAINKAVFGTDVKGEELGN